MKPATIKRKKYSVLQFATLLLFGYSLAGCAGTDSPSPESSTSSEIRGALTHTIRIVIHLEETASDNKPLSTAISDACRCLPIFFRTIGTHGLIYSVTLSQEMDYSAFERELMLKAPQLGIVTIEQDTIEQFQ